MLWGPNVPDHISISPNVEVLSDPLIFKFTVSSCLCIPAVKQKLTSRCRLCSEPYERSILLHISGLDLFVFTLHKYRETRAFKQSHVGSRSLIEQRFGT